DSAEQRFSAGRLVMPGQNWGHRWESVLDYEPSGSRAPTGLAVQQRGELLFVSHATTNEIRVFDKRSGELRTTIAVQAPGDLDVAADDSLWAVCTVAGKRAVAHVHEEAGRWRQATVVGEGLRNPVAIGVSPLDGTLVVADAETEQLKAFDGAGELRWT